VRQPDLSAQIAMAKTPANHEAIAAEYEEARAAREKAAEHEEMGASYSGGAAKEQIRLADHCRAIAKRFREQAVPFVRRRARTMGEEGGAHAARSLPWRRPAADHSGWRRGTERTHLCSSAATLGRERGPQ
jgi:hypothetical protein